MRKMIQSNAFALAELVLVLICALLWAFLAEFGWIILLVSLLPWGLRIATGCSPFRRTTLDLFIVVFLFVAGVGVWAAYNQSTAWEKFWWIVAACRLYYAIAVQPQSNRRVVATLVAATAAWLSLQFLLTFDWQAHPLLEPIDRIGSVWMGFRPDLPLPIPEPDFIGGLSAMLAPTILVLAIEAYQDSNKRHFSVILTIGFILTLGLLMSAERPAWLGLFLAAGLWLSWQGCLWLAERTSVKATTFALIGLVLLALSSFSLGAFIWQRYANYGSLPGRVEEIINGIHLALEYPIIGGGLGATPGLYSRYMLGIPYLFIPNIHNQYLDLAIETGLFGLVAVLVIFAQTLIKLYYSRPKEENRTKQFALYKWAPALGIIILAWHSFVEDVFYSNWGLVFFLILPGLAISYTQPPETQRTSKRNRSWIPVLCLTAIILIVFFQPLKALWRANLGAVKMSQGQLQGWPDEPANQEFLFSHFSQAKSHFEQAIAASPNQPTANYRLGLIATDLRNFETANVHLEIAYQQRPHHRGIQKALGYSYAWLGEVEPAGQILSAIPEAAYELSIYAQWWASKNRDDLSDYATQTEIWLEKK